MQVEIRSLIPLAHVKSVARAIEFYQKLGFKVGNTFIPDKETEPVWAWLESGRAQLMVAQADEPVLPERRAVLFYAYFDDVPAAKDALTAVGLRTGEIAYPFYAPKGEFRLVDPDGYVIMVTHT